jgi:hypothetical protein
MQHKQRLAERLDLRDFVLPEKRKIVNDGLLNGLMVGVRPGTEEWREARRRAVMVWRLAGRDKWTPNYGKGSRGKKIPKEAEVLRRKMIELGFIQDTKKIRAKE